MYNRKYSYDSLRQSLRNLSEAIPKQNQVFSKSAEENTLGVFQKYVDLNNEKEIAGAAIYNQFKDLKFDFDNGIIHMKRYTEHLQAYKDFYNSAISKYDVPKSLTSEEILTEIQKYIG